MTELFSTWLAEQGITPVDSVLSASLDLAIRGVHVFPLAGKRPRHDLHHGVLEASVDIRQIVGWFSRSDDSGVGVAIGVGALEGVRVLDIDPRHGGDANIARLGELPETLTIETGRRDGGRHFYFLVPSGTYREKLCGPKGGVEFLGRGKYVVAPPSIHPDTGFAYRVASPAHVGIRPAPAWLLDLARVREQASGVAPMPIASTSTTERARRYLAKVEPAISGSNGHDQTFIAALKLTRGFGLDVATAFALMSNDFNPRCKPPWSARELRRKVEQAAERGRMDPGAIASARRA